MAYGLLQMHWNDAFRTENPIQEWFPEGGYVPMHDGAYHRARITFRLLAVTDIQVLPWSASPINVNSAKKSDKP